MAGAESLTERLMTGLKHQHEGAYDRAIAQWQAILADHPNHMGALAQLGVSLFWSGQREAGLAKVAEAVAAQPDVAALHHHHATLLLEMQRMADGLDALTKAGALAQDNPMLLSMIVDDFIRLGRTKEARRLARAERGDDPRLLAARAKALIADRLPEEALAIAVDAYERAPMDPFVLEAYGAAAILAGQDAKTADILALAERMPAELCERLFLVWARLLEANAAYRPAFDFLNALVASGSDTVAVLIDHARLGLALDKVAEAKHSLDRVMRANAHIPTVHLLLGDYFLRKGQLAQAVPALRAALDGNPFLVEAYRLLAQCGALLDQDRAELAQLAESPALSPAARKTAQTLLTSLG